MKKILVKCPQCGKEKIIEVDSEKWKRYIEGELIQNVFPDMSADVREELITGICSKCWKNIFLNDEDDSLAQ